MPSGKVYVSSVVGLGSDCDWAFANVRHQMGRTIVVPQPRGKDVATLVLPEKANQHLQRLMDRNNEGLLSEE